MKKTRVKFALEFPNGRGGPQYHELCASRVQSFVITQAILLNDLRHSWVVYIECGPAWQPVLLLSCLHCFQKPPPARLSFNRNSLFLSDSSPPPNILIFSLVTFLLCQLPSPSAFSPLLPPHLTLLALSYTFSICMPLLSRSSFLCSLPFYFSFRFTVVQNVLVFTFCLSSFIFLSIPFIDYIHFISVIPFLVHYAAPLRLPSDSSDSEFSLFSYKLNIFISSSDRTRGILPFASLVSPPSHRPALSLQHAASSLLLLLYSSQQWVSDLNLSPCITALPFCSSGIPFENQ